MVNTFIQQGLNAASQMQEAETRAQEVLTPYISKRFPYRLDLFRAKILASVYHNIGLMFPVFQAYQDLVAPNKPLPKEALIFASALMLLEDAVLDELTVNSVEVEKVFSQSSPQLFSTEPFLLLLRDFRCAYLNQIEPPFRHTADALIYQLHQVQNIPPDARASFNELNRLSVEKGYWLPTLVYAINPTMSENEIIILKQVGALMKHMDDYVDQCEDTKKGEVSVYTYIGSERKRNTCLNRHEELARQAIMHLHYANEKIDRFWLTIRLFNETFRYFYQTLYKLPTNVSNWIMSHRWATLKLLEITSAIHLPIIWLKLKRSNDSTNRVINTSNWAAR